MRKLLIATTIGAYMVLGSQAFARESHGEDHGRGSDHEQHDHGGGHNAPEPLTVLGLGLGAGGVATARWLQKRKR